MKILDKTYPHEHVHWLEPVDTNGKRRHESSKSGEIGQLAREIHAVEVVLEHVIWAKFNESSSIWFVSGQLSWLYYSDGMNNERMNE